MSEYVDKGWRSRKAKLALAAAVVPYVTATVAWLVLERMDADQWVSLCQWLLPAVLAIYGAADVADKRAGQ